jgi:hypothetical protein
MKELSCVVRVATEPKDNKRREEIQRLAHLETLLRLDFEQRSRRDPKAYKAAVKELHELRAQMMDYTFTFDPKVDERLASSKFKDVAFYIGYTHQIIKHLLYSAGGRTVPSQSTRLHLDAQIKATKGIKEAGLKSILVRKKTKEARKKHFLGWCDRRPNTIDNPFLSELVREYLAEFSTERIPKLILAQQDAPTVKEAEIIARKIEEIKTLNLLGLPSDASTYSRYRKGD